MKPQKAQVKDKGLGSESGDFSTELTESRASITKFVLERANSKRVLEALPKDRFQRIFPRNPAKKFSECLYSILASDFQACLFVWHLLE